MKSAINYRELDQHEIELVSGGHSIPPPKPEPTPSQIVAGTLALPGETLSALNQAFAPK